MFGHIQILSCRNPTLEISVINRIEYNSKTSLLHFSTRCLGAKSCPLTLNVLLKLGSFRLRPELLEVQKGFPSIPTIE